MYLLLKNILFKVSGNYFAQTLLEKTVNMAQFLMGIGSGSEVRSSGEHAIFHILKKRLSPPYCIFDVGSNKGQFLALILENLGIYDLSVHCFEPGRETFKFLTKSVAGDQRIKLNNSGIGREKGEALLYFDSAGSGLASLTRRRLDHFGVDFDKSERIELNTIDSYSEENAIDRINVLKIDIEGHELDALTGAKKMIDKKCIDFITFEFGGCNIDTRTFFQDFWYFFNEREMDIFRITGSGYLYPLESYKEIHEQF